MIQRLGPWQRFWGMFALVFLVSTIVLIISIWPSHDAAVVADLQSPGCREWREMADTGGPYYYPEPGVPCRAIRLFLYEQHLTLRSEADYDAFLLKAGMRSALLSLGVWAGFSALMYALGLFARKFVVNVLDRGKRGTG